MTTLDDSEFTTARGFNRNTAGRPMVTHPDTGKLVAYWGASEWPLDGPYTGDPIYGERGTWVHDLVYYLLGAQTADGLKERREELGIPADVAKHIAADWQRLVDEHAIVVHHVEHPSVNDRYEIASPVDLVATVGGQPAIIDIKTAGDYRKTSYAVQCVYYVGSVKYVDGVRSEWFGEYAGEVAAYLAHFPLSAALKAHAAGDPLPRWELHPVDVEAARPWADMLHTLRRANPRVAFPDRAEVVDIPNEYAVIPAGFVDKIAAPDERTATAPPVEQPAGEADLPPASPANPDRRVDELIDPDFDNRPEVIRARAMYDVDRFGPPTLPPASPANPDRDVDRFGRPILPPADEGDDADPDAIAALKARYAALTGEGRAWVNGVAKQAQAAGGALSLADSQPQTIRRFEGMRALVLLAEGGFADDPATRGILRPILGDVADMPIFTVGKLVAALDQHEAARFAQLADAIANGSVALSVKLDGRYEWEFAA